MTMTMFHTPHLEKLRASCITEAYATKAGISSVSSAAAAAVIGMSESPGDALLIPYRDLAGNPIPSDDGTPHMRARIFDVSGRGFRYASRPGSGSALYIPPGIAPLLMRSKFLVVTEGELKAAGAVCCGLAAVALPGVTTWAAEPGSGLSESTPVMPELLDVCRAVPAVVVLADSDGAKNADVRRAFEGLAAAIRAQTGIPAIYATCPAPKQLEGYAGKPGDKIGLDDWLYHHRGQVKPVEDMLAWRVSRAIKRNAIEEKFGYDPLGYEEGDVYHIYSRVRGQEGVYTAADLARPATLMSIVGPQYARELYMRYTDRGEVVDWMQLTGDIIQACQSYGLYKPNRLRGAGVWYESGHIYVNGDTLWSPTQPDARRLTQTHIYQRTRDLDIEPTTQLASVADAKEVLNTLSAWRYERGLSDARLMLGLLMLSYVPGALKWRPVTFIHANGGAGKSELLKLLKKLAGPCASLTEKQSEAGLRQKVIKRDAVAVFCDESEVNGKYIADLLNFFRLSASGSTQAMGTADQKGVEYTLRALGIVAGVTPPKLESQDETRFLKIGLHVIPKEAAGQLPALALDEDRCREVGRGLFARILHLWPIFSHAFDALYRALEGTHRMANVVAPVLAGYYVAMNDSYIDDIPGFLGQFDLDDDIARISEASEDADFYEHMLSSVIDIEIEGRRTSVAVGDALCLAAAHPANNRQLGKIGIRVENDQVWVAYRNPGLSKLFAGTKWAGADLSVLLRRIHGASKTSPKAKIGGVSTRYISIPMPQCDDIESVKSRTILFSGA